MSDQNNKALDDAKNFIDNAISGNKTIKSLEEGAKEAQGKVDSLQEKQSELTESIKSLVNSQKELSEGMNTFVKSLAEQKSVEAKAIEEENKKLKEEVNKKSLKNLHPIEEQEMFTKSLDNTDFGQSVNSFLEHGETTTGKTQSFQLYSTRNKNAKDEIASVRRILNPVKSQKAYNTFDDARGGLANPYPIFSGLIDENIVSSSNMFRLCKQINVGNVMNTQTEFTRYDLHLIPSFNQTPELSSVQASGDIKNATTKISVKEFTQYTEISRKLLHQSQYGYGKFDFIGLHNQALDKAMMKDLDSMFFTGDGTNNQDGAGVLGKIAKGNVIPTYTSASNTELTLTDILKAAAKMKAALRGAGPIDVVVNSSTFMHMLTTVTTGSGEYLNLQFILQNKGGVLQIADNFAIRFIIIDNNDAINPNNEAKYETLEVVEGTAKASKLVAIMGYFNTCCVYAVSSAVESGLLPLEKESLQTGIRTMFKTFNVGFDITHTEALRAIVTPA